MPDKPKQQTEPRKKRQQADPNHRIDTKFFRIRNNDELSLQIAKLAAQQRLAYNWAADVLNRSPNIPLFKTPDTPNALLGQLTTLRHADHRFNAPYHIHAAAVRQAHAANLRLQADTLERRERIAHGSTLKSDLKHHRRTLAHRSRKHSSHTLTSIYPPIRLDGRSFTIPGARHILITTKKEIPRDLDIRSFQLVEIMPKRWPAPPELVKKRYKLHVQTREKTPVPSTPEEVTSAGQILGADDGSKIHIAFSNGQNIHHDETELKNEEKELRKRAKGKKSGSKRQAKLRRQANEKSRKRRANRRRIFLSACKEILKESGFLALAVEKKRIKNLTRSAAGTAKNPGKNVRAKTALNRVLQDAAPSEKLHILIREAMKLGINTYPVYPQGSSQTCQTCGDRRKENRETQALFLCRNCGFTGNADTNGAMILKNRAYYFLCVCAGRPTDTVTHPTGRRAKPS